MATQNKKVVQAIVISASISLIIAGILFYFFYRLTMDRRLKKTTRDSSFRREAATGVPQVEWMQHGGAIKGIIVDEEGLDVLYLRRLEGRNCPGCFSKVWHNPMREEVKRMDSRGEKPSVSEPIQEIPLLQEPIGSGYEYEMKQPLHVNLNLSPMSEMGAPRMASGHAPSLERPISPPPGMRRGPPSPPPTPPHQMDVDSSLVNKSLPPPLPPPPPPTPPPPPPLPRKGNSKPAPPPGPPKLKPAPPPPPAKARGMTSANKPPIASIVADNRHSREEALAKESLKENEVQMKLKPLHWDKVTANADHSMVWNEISDGSFRFDGDLMEALFGYAPTSQKSSTEKSNRSSNLGNSSSFLSAQTFLLDPRKSQNTAIVLRSLGISRKEILDALLEGRGLNADTLEKLTKICPTQEEITKILQFDGNPTKLADAESFLYHILKAVPSAFIRFNAMLFRSTYDPDILHLKESLQTLELGCKELRNGGIFLKLLEAILKAGNRLNAGTNRGNARGFNLTALRRLSDVKSTDGKTTLLQFVVEQVIRSEGKRCLINRNHNPGGISNGREKDGDTTIEENDKEHLMLGLPVVESLNTEFANVKKSASIDYESLITMCSSLTTRADEMKQLLTRCTDLQSAGFLREMKGFLEDCQEELNVVREEEKRVMDIVRKTTVYYQAGDSKIKGGNPLQLFVIVKDFLSNLDQVCAEISKKLQKTKVATAAGSTPPLSPTIMSPARFQNLQLYFKALRPGTSSSDSDSEDDF